MIYYPEEPKSFRQLTSAVNRAYKSCEKLRTTRLSAIKEYVGKNYSENGADASVPLNLLEFAVNVYLRQLTANNPQVLASTKFPELRPAADMFESALNQLLIELNAHETFKRAVLDAMFGVGVVKIGMSEDVRTEVLGYTHVVGVPFMDHIDIEDMYFDTTATRFDQQAFVGHVYRMPEEVARESNLFENIEETLEAYKTKMQLNHEQSVRHVMSPDGGEIDDVDDVDMLSILELWLPHTNQIVSLLVDPYTHKVCCNKPLRLDEWTGPVSGPYQYLGFIDVPGQLLPNNPVGIWFDIHKFVNASYRKLIRQASRAKDVVTFVGGDEDDVQRIMYAEDGQVVKSNNPNAVTVNKYGGIDETSLGFMLQVKQIFSEMAGNLDSLGGIAPSANTLGQESMLSEASNRRVQEMQDRVINFATSCIRCLGELLWHAPGQDILIQRKIEYQGRVLVDTALSWPTPGNPDYPADLREGPFANYDIHIEPYSMAHLGPSERMAVLDQTISDVLLPMLPILQEQGLFIDMRRLLEIKAHYMGIPEMTELIMDQSGQLGQPKEPSGQPSFTGGSKSREVRHNYEGIRNRRSSTQEKVDSLMKGSPND